MAYYVRVLTPSAGTIEPSALASSVANLGCRLSGDISASSWDQLEVQNASGEALFIVERNTVFEGSLAQNEIAEFQSEIADARPKSGADWLRTYLASVKTIYAFQLLDGLDQGNGWTVLQETKTTLWNAVGGIFQADGEGFSNEEGYHILWQFSDAVDGDWWMAVIKDEAWQKFRMNLGDPLHRDAFMSGNIPDGVERTAAQ